MMKTLSSTLVAAALVAVCGAAGAAEAAGDGFTADVVASSTMDLRILLGIAYEVGFGDF